MKEKNLKSAGQLVQQYAKDSLNLEAVEVEVAAAELLIERNQPILAYHQLLTLIEKSPGSMPALKAWGLIENLVREENYDLQELQRLANMGNFTQAPAELLPFLDYLVIMENRGLSARSPGTTNSKWSRNAEKRLDSNSYWGIFYEIQKFWFTLPSDPSEQTLKDFRSLLDKTVPYPNLHRKMLLQEARFLQSLKQPAQALKLYESFRPEGREAGRQMFERAWNLYNLKQYSSSLGLLQTLKTPAMRMAIEPEVYVLAMLAYRDLCHYPAVAMMRRQYMSVFDETLNRIKDGTPFENIVVLSHLVAQVDPWANLANEITELKVQREALHNERLFSVAETKELDEKAAQLEKILVDRLRNRSVPELKKQAERLIALTEQMKLLEYLSDLQEFQLSADGDDRLYRSEKAKATGSEGLFWAVDGEDWQDEFGTFKVLVSDRCPAKKERR